MVTGLSPFIIPTIPQMIQDHGGMRGEAGGEGMILWETSGAEIACNRHARRRGRRSVLRPVACFRKRVRAAPPGFCLSRPRFFLLFLLLAPVGACRQEIVPDVYKPTHAHDAYVHSLRLAALENTALGRDWISASVEVLSNP
ncbi:MAG: hypothetical protein H6Q05_2554, partial [Acidobacteria bacterium]|nr:hypothetical protein [Acidobacteriota bacterium]